MLQKFYSQAFSARSAFDEAGNISDDQIVKNSQIRLERRERIIRHSDIGVGEFVEEA